RPVREVLLRVRALAAMSGAPPPPSLKKLTPQRAPRHLFLIYAGRGGGRRGIQRRLLPRSARTESALEDRRGATRRRLPGAPAPMRATRRRLLRPRAPRKGVKD